MTKRVLLVGAMGLIGHLVDVDLATRPETVVSSLTRRTHPFQIVF